MIYNTEITQRKDIVITKVPQIYLITCYTTGKPLDDQEDMIVYQDGSDSGVIVNKESCNNSSYQCWSPYRDTFRRMDDSADLVQESRVVVNWTGSETTGNLFRPDVNNGDHCYSCVVSAGNVKRVANIGCIRGKVALLLAI